MKEIPVTSKNVKIGLKVKRGPDWCYENQDENSKFGTIVRQSETKWYVVEWESGYRDSYKVGKDKEDICDLCIYMPSVVKPGSETIVKKALRINRVENITEEMLIENGLQEHLI